MKNKYKCFVCCFGILLILFSQTMSVKADEWKDAYTFYTTYGKDMIFRPTGKTSGDIYFAREAKLSDAKIKYYTLGWKAVITDESGRNIQNIYYKIEGEYITLVNNNRTAKSGYLYQLFKINLYSIKNRMNQEAKDLLKVGKCNITFQACMTVQKNGVLQGSINDYGVVSGKVYETYGGIVGAESWTTETKEALKSNYDKQVRNLFYDVIVQKGPGIGQVSGQGTYCYGTQAVISAEPETGYRFLYWLVDDSVEGTSQIQLIVGKNTTCSAYGTAKSIKVSFHQNLPNEADAMVSKTYYYNKENQNFVYPGWTTQGYFLSGWSMDSNSKNAEYELTQQVENSWILEQEPKAQMYGIWKANSYSICFDGGGANLGKQETIETSYDQTIDIPECNYQFASGEYQFLGWSLGKEKMAEYIPKNQASVAELVQKCNLEQVNHGVIYLYAVWDAVPVLHVSDLYYPLEGAQSGKITETELASKASAYDEEDGMISYGMHENNSFYLPRYTADKYLSLEKETQLDETYVVCDSAGNTVEKTVQIHLVNTTIEKERELIGKARLISKKYFENENQNLVPETSGGLNSDSCWAKNPEYRNLLRSVLSK